MSDPVKPTIRRIDASTDATTSAGPSSRPKVTPLPIGIDRGANPDNGKGRFVLMAFRATQALRAGGRPPLVGRCATLAYRFVTDWIMGIDLPPEVVAGPGLAIYHGTGLVVHPSTVIGSGVLLRHGVTLGALGDGRGGDDGDAGAVRAPVIGDRVTIGAGAIVLGEVTIGDDAVVGAGAVVVHDVAAGAVVVGNPARPIPRSTTPTDSSGTGTVG